MWLATLTRAGGADVLKTACPGSGGAGCL